MLESLMSNELVRLEVQAQNVADSHYELSVAGGQDSEKYVVTYDVSSRGDITGDLEEFRKLAGETLADPRGWSRAGVKFVEVEDGGQMHLVLATGDEVEAISPWGCAEEWSCVVKPYVMINDARWMGASDAYNERGEALRNYRHMVIEHEVGHFLGHNHVDSCKVDGGLAPIMQTQSVDMKGCETNYWPLSDELWVRL